MKREKGKKLKVKRTATEKTTKPRASANAKKATAGAEPPLGTAAATNGTVARRSTATAETATAKVKATEAETLPSLASQMSHESPSAPQGTRTSVNPLFDLSEEERSKLFTWLRECPYDDAVLQMLHDEGLPGITREQLNDFFHDEAEYHWEKRITRAAVEANALVRLVERSPVKFSSGILAALGQEAFRQISSGQVEPQAMGRIATLFLKARSDERTDQMQELKREKVRHELHGQVEHALEKLAEEVDRNPLAREAFAALRRELGEKPDEMTE